MLAPDMNGVFFGFLVPVFYEFAMKNPDETTTEMFYGIHTEIGANLGNSLDIIKLSNKCAVGETTDFSTFIV